MKLKHLTYLFIALAAFVVLTTIYGIIKSYSGIPFWDEWDGYLKFYDKMQVGGTTLFKAFFEQHNEHKILFSRLWFWVGFTFFKGALWFQILIGFLLQVLVWIPFIFIIKKNKNINDNYKIILISFTGILLFSWIQENNFTWGFQTQFFGVTTNGILSLFFLAHYYYSKKIFFLVLSISFLFLCVFSFASGVFFAISYGLMVLIIPYSIKKRTLVIIVVAFYILLYLFNFHQVLGHTPIGEALTQHFILRYLGGPFVFLFKGYIADICGALFPITLFYLLYKTIIKHNIKSYYHMVLLLIALYVFITACFTAMGRVGVVGIEGASASRYTTPVLLGWIGILLFLILEDYIKIKYYLTLLVFISIAFTAYQINPIVSNFHNSNLIKKREFLGFRLGVKSENFKVTLYPFPIDTIIFKNVINNKMSAFGEPYIANVHKTVNSYKTVDSFSNDYIGALDSIYNIASDSNYNFIQGWSMNKNTYDLPDFILITDKNKQNIGYAVSGSERGDVKNVFGHQLYTGFEGYCKKGFKEKDMLFFFYNTHTNILSFSKLN